MAEIQFTRGVAETVVPDVRMTRSKDGTNGTATFYFDNPDALSDAASDITGMYLVDEEGTLVTQDVNAKFVNGEPTAIEATYAILNPSDWERFMRFMNRYAEENGLGFTKS